MKVFPSVPSESTQPPRQPRSVSALLAGSRCYVAAHLPFLAPSLEDIDSINFALGLRDFDVAQHQPHPPGYPVYIALGPHCRWRIAASRRAVARVGRGSKPGAGDLVGARRRGGAGRRVSRSFSVR